jgi:spoIIIJ-associated protein
MDAEESLEITALSTDEAILIGLTRLAATRDEVTIEILDEGSRGFLGLGTRMARVKLSRRDPQSTDITSSAPIAAEIDVLSDESKAQQRSEPSAEKTSSSMPVISEPAPSVVDKDERQQQMQASATDAQDDASLLYQRIEETVHLTAEQLLSSLSVKLSTEWRNEENRPTLWISIHGADADSIVGPRAQTLNAVQYLFRTLVHRQVAGNYDLVVDADGYRMRRRRSLENMAQKNADKAVQSGLTVRLRSMPAYERRLIHIILREDDRVQTRSVGSGRDRAITIIPNSASDK